MADRNWWQGAWAFIFGLFAPVVTILLLYEVVQLWPVLEATGASPTTVTADGDAAFAATAELEAGFGMHWTLSANQALVLLATGAGLIGGLLYTMGIYARNRRRGTFRHGDANWYWVRCVIAAGLGLGVYALLRAGLFVLGGQESDDLPSAFGVVGIGITAGLFTDKVLKKLEEIAGNFFASEEELAEEEGKAAKTIVVYGVEPMKLVKGLAGQTLTFKVRKPDDGPLRARYADDVVDVPAVAGDAMSYRSVVPDQYVSGAELPVKIDLGEGALWSATIAVEAPPTPT